MKFKLSKYKLFAVVLIYVISYGAWASEEDEKEDEKKRLQNVIKTMGLTKDELVQMQELELTETIDQLCSPVSRKLNMDKLSFEFRAPCQDHRYPLQDGEKVLREPAFDIKKKVAFFINGWLSNIVWKSDYIYDMAKAHNCRGGYNFLALDVSNPMNTLDDWSGYDIEQVGAWVAELLVKLTQKVPLDNIQLIGHSMGAHIAGEAGRQFQKLTGKIIPRITGLDPAERCHQKGSLAPTKPLFGLYRGDAAFVDIIHTNTDVLGELYPIGDVDFYPEGMQSLMPGCTLFGCSHNRAYQYYTESVYPVNEKNFLAKRCKVLRSLNDSSCDGPEYPMGFATPLNLKGNFLLSVAADVPFGKNAPKDSITKTRICGRCESSG